MERITTQSTGGQNQELPRTGELITLPDGTPLIVLGEPRDEDQVGRLLEGAIIVLDPTGRPCIHIPTQHAPGAPPLWAPWDLGWKSR